MRRTALKFIAIAALALLSAGCASNGGTKYRDMANVLAKIKPGEGRIFFFRADTPFGSALQPGVRLDKVAVGKSRPGSFFFVDRPAGTYLAATVADPQKTLGIPLEEGETKYVRMSPSFGLVTGSIVLDLETPEKAKAELGWLAYSGQALLDK
ncbi:hypothetical protein [Variovorax sp. SG517]|uniref:hypothetical protein n=1 Tax=unclassified Variovorax TaxID=663243 RepID=UPI00159D61AF|nr:hypothetical protein [Variovorax sp. SG517]NVM92342.1 hypothetical protein [Variovorax sp. SG517]